MKQLVKIESTTGIEWNDDDTFYVKNGSVWVNINWDIFGQEILRADELGNIPVQEVVDALNRYKEDIKEQVQKNLSADTDSEKQSS